MGIEIAVSALAAHEHQKRMMYESELAVQSAKIELNKVACLYGDGHSAKANGKSIQATKCHSCGSRDFKEHRGERICSYCRSEA